MTRDRAHLEHPPHLSRADARVAGLPTPLAIVIAMGPDPGAGDVANACLPLSRARARTRGFAL